MAMVSFGRWRRFRFSGGFFWAFVSVFFCFLSVKFQGVIAVLHGMKQQLVFLRTLNVCYTTYIRDIRYNDLWFSVLMICFHG